MRALITALTLAALAGCATGMQIYADHDARQVFTAYRSYAWIRDEPLIRAAGSDYTVSPLNRRRVVEAVEAELDAKGFTKATNRANADFVLAYTIGARNMIEANSYPEPYNGGWGWGHQYFGSGINVQTYVQGTLAIDIFDRRSRQPVWHGWAQKRITDDDRKNAEERIHAAVKAILKSFPPT